MLSASVSVLSLANLRAALILVAMLRNWLSASLVILTGRLVCATWVSKAFINSMCKLGELSKFLEYSSNIL